MNAPVEGSSVVYKAVVSRGADTWQVDVPEFGVTTRARRIDQAADEAGKAICSSPVAPHWGFNVSVEMADPYVRNGELEPAVVCDIDGTLALRNHRGPYDFEKVETDDLNRPVADLLDLYESAGYHIVLLSGRQEEYRAHTERWLEKHCVSYGQLLMRAEGDRRSDDLVKMELFDENIRHNYCVSVILDDRDRCVRLWRLLGLTCWQVADGAF